MAEQSHDRPTEPPSPPDGLTRRGFFAPLAAATAAVAAGGALDSIVHAAPASAADTAAAGAQTTTIAELRAMTGPPAASVYAVTDPGAEGVFVVDPDDTASPDNTGTVIVSAAGTRFVRLHAPNVVNVRWFGALGDNGHGDDASAINAAIAHALAVRGESTSGFIRPIVYFPPCRGYVTRSTISVPVGIQVLMDAPIVDKSGKDQAALEIGEEGAFNRQVHLRLKALRSPVSDWGSEECVGVRLISLETCTVEVVQSENFTIGVQCVGMGQGFSYNNVSLGRLNNSRIGVDLTNRKVGSRIGWCNENLFFNGRFSENSQTHKGLGRIGVRITSQDGTYVNNNNNNFYKPSFELRASDAAPAEALGVLIEHGRMNRVVDARDESNSLPMARVLNGSSENVIETGYGYAFVDEQSDYRSTIGITRRRQIMQSPSSLYTSGPLAEQACYYDGDTRLHIPGVSFADPADGSVSLAGPATLTGSAIEVADDGQHAPGVLVDTTNVRRFIVRRACEPGAGGRLYILAFDADGNRLADPGDGLAHAYVRPISEYPIEWSPELFGGCYQSRPDHGEDMLVSVTDAVASIRLHLWKGTGPLRLRAFAVEAADPGHAAVSAGVPQLAGGLNVALKPPTTGAWPMGKVIANAGSGVAGRGLMRSQLAGWRKGTDAPSNVVGTDWIEMFALTGQ